MNTAIVLVSDLNYLPKAERTIIDIRSKGEWTQDIVLITIDCHLHHNFRDFYRVQEVELPYIHLHIHEKLKLKPYQNSDLREIHKINQWQKLNVFHPFFKKWQKIIFFDAGYRVLDKIKYFDQLDCTNSLLAPIDHPQQTLGSIFSSTHQEDYQKFINDYGTSRFHELYLMNCTFIYDTQILDLFNFYEFISLINQYTIWRLNEMSFMNFFFIMKLNVWKPYPTFITTDQNIPKRLHEWSEHCVPNSNWRDFVGIKYPVTINFDCK